MANLKVGGIIEATVDRASNSGNGVIEGDSKGSIALLKSGSWKQGDTANVKITSKEGTTYTAVPLSKEAGASAPPLHHDGDSVGKTRRMGKAFDSVEEREFNPKTHGAPELNSTKSSSGKSPATYVDPVDTDPNKSLQEIAKDLDEPVVTDEQEEE